MKAIDHPKGGEGRAQEGGATALCERRPPLHASDASKLGEFGGAPPLLVPRRSLAANFFPT
jgi:hypothetical protein